MYTFVYGGGGGDDGQCTRTHCTQGHPASTPGNMLGITSTGSIRVINSAAALRTES